jgi:DNA-binding transcriptional ArsR family regulator
MSKDLLELNKKLDQIISLLKLLASDKIVEKRRIILSTPKKQNIYDLCDGQTEMGEIANKAGVSREYVRLTIRDLEDAGFVTVKINGRNRYPLRAI